MDVEISPEPSAEDRTAILRALTAVLAEAESSPGPWWQAGVVENAETDEPDD